MSYSNHDYDFAAEAEAFRQHDAAEAEKRNAPIRAAKNELLVKRQAKQITTLTAENERLRGEVEKLAAFKAYVHKRFDDAGVPANPEPPKHALEGCRVGDRFDFVTSELTTLREQLAEAITKLETIVVPDGVDAGVIWLSQESPTHYDADVKGQVYDHENFSPLGDALVELHKILSAARAAGGA